MIHCLPIFAFVFSHLTLTSAKPSTGDGEWPPLPDPQWSASANAVIGDPAVGSPLYLDRIEFTIPNDAPYYYRDWIAHFHEGGSCCSTCSGGYKIDFTIGDVDNDGAADDIVITMAGDAVFAAEMVLDFSSVPPVGHVNPL